MSYYPRAALAGRYSLFALASGLANLGAQAGVLQVTLLGSLRIPLAIAVGTGLGLVMKFLLDKIWIFRDFERSVVGIGRQFTIYSAFGIGTTAIFWAVEYVAHLITASDTGTLLGGALGLLIGYGVKYRLDKRFTFFSSVAEANGAEAPRIHEGRAR